MAKMMFNEHMTPKKFWAKAINTTCHVPGPVFIQAFLTKTYELRFG